MGKEKHGGRKKISRETEGPDSNGRVNGNGEKQPSMTERFSTDDSLEHPPGRPCPIEVCLRTITTTRRTLRSPVKIMGLVGFPNTLP